MTPQRKRPISDREPAWAPAAARLLRDGRLADALTLINARGAETLAHRIWVASRYTLQPVEVAEAYCECLEALARRLADADFDLEKPLWPYLSKVAWSKGLNQLRARQRCHEQQTSEEVLGSISTKPENRQLELQETLAEVMQVISDLPEKQRLVARIYFTNFFQEFVNGNDFLRLAFLVAQETGEEERSESVRKTLEAAKEKIRQALLAKGWQRHPSPRRSYHEREKDPERGN